MNSANIVKHEQTFQDIKDEMLDKYKDVFKENLSPQDKIVGTRRIEMDTENVKPLHFSTPKKIPAHLRKVADKELKRCLDAGKLEECHHHTPWLSRGMSSRNVLGMFLGVK